MHQLIGAERIPEAGVLGIPAVAVGDLLLQPIDVIMQHELAESEAGDEQQRARQQHQVDQRRQRGMDAGMDEAARMAVLSLVQELIRRLQIKIGDRMLGHENGDGGEGEQDELWHRAISTRPRPCRPNRPAGD